MVQFVEMDAGVSLADQLRAESSGPVVLINKFTVAEADAGHLLEAWRQDAARFKAQPGFISTQLHRGIAGSSVFLNYAVWESVEDFRRAFEQRATAKPSANIRPARSPPRTSSASSPCPGSAWRKEGGSVPPAVSPPTPGSAPESDVSHPTHSACHPRASGDPVDTAKRESRQPAS